MTFPIVLLIAGIVLLLLGLLGKIQLQQFGAAESSNTPIRVLVSIIGVALMGASYIVYLNDKPPTLPTPDNSSTNVSRTSASPVGAITPTSQGVTPTPTNSPNTGNLSVNASNAGTTIIKPRPCENAESHTKVDIFPSNWNEDAADTNSLPELPSFTIDQPHCITNIFNRHWGGAQPSGKGMKLRNSAGEEFGPWEVGTGDIDTWACRPRIQIPAGTYFVIDPDPASWSHNAKSNNKGMSLVVGYAVSGNTK